jgi:hypothetical protein
MIDFGAGHPASGSWQIEPHNHADLCHGLNGKEDLSVSKFLRTDVRTDFRV